MAAEHEHGPILLTAIHIDLQEKSVTFEAADESAIRFRLRPEGLYYQVIVSPITQRAVEKLVDVGEKDPTTTTAERREAKEAPVSVTGRLKTQPREGRPDARGNPTAWARLAVHEEGRQRARVLSATFHRHTAKIAVGLPKDTQITVQGYVHPSNDPSDKRLDTISVVNLVAYPGKPEKGSAESSA